MPIVLGTARQALEREGEGNWGMRQLLTSLKLNRRNKDELRERDLNYVVNKLTVC